MGGSFSRILYKRLFGNKEVKILLLGLDAAGKTTMLYKMKLGEVVTTIPTIGFNVETVQYKNVSVITWDVGGRDKIRPLWRHYMADTAALIFMVDSNDRERISEAAEEIHKALNEEQLKDAILLVLANKADLPNAMSNSEITEKLNLHSLRRQKWYIQSTCCTSGDGIYEGLDWLSSTLSKNEWTKVVSEPATPSSDSPSSITNEKQTNSVIGWIKSVIVP